MDKKVLIIIPAFNEESNIVSTVTSVKRLLPHENIVVVNDGSRDKTSQLASRAGAIVIDHLINLGDGAARQTGFKYAVLKGYDYAVHLDADGQHNPHNILDILQLLKTDKFDIVIGSRFLEKKHDSTLLRNLGIRIFSFIVSLLTKERITDATSGLRGVSRKAMLFYVNHFYPEYYPDADVIIASHYAGLKIKEIPVKMNKRTHGKSLHSGLSPIYYIYKMCLSIFAVFFYRYGGHDAD